MRENEKIFVLSIISVVALSIVGYADNHGSDIKNTVKSTTETMDSTEATTAEVT